MEKDARKISPKAQEALRFRAVKAVLGGRSQTEVARTFGLARGTVARWVGIYRKKGWEGLKGKRRGRPRGGKLDERQVAVICDIIRNHRPDQLKLPFASWTREAVGELIERKFGIRLSVSTVGRYLRRWGFTPEKRLKKGL